MLTHEEWVNGARYKSLLGAPPPANPVRNTKRDPLKVNQQTRARVLFSRSSVSVQSKPIERMMI